MMPVRGHPTCGTITFGSALEFAVRTAAAWQKRKPPVPVPSDIKPFGKQPRLAAAALGRVRRIVDGDPEFRARLAAAAVPELVDEIGIAWLRQEPGWEEHVGGLVELLEQEAAERDSERLLAQEQRRRVAAEDAAIRTRAELVALTERLGEREIELQSAPPPGVGRRVGARSPATVGRRAQARRASRPRPGRGSASSARACGNRTRRRDPASRRRRVAARRVAGLAGRAAGRVARRGPDRLGCANSPRWPVPSGTN